ncbi:hypothetical protein PLICRDRAFT_181222 [Plicaturopsis crispa FD-325 SS-3]|uniref:Uncharacterized protein n=1 Tax=Plicaturopsis crispa FD-325 SS-3 TaxID=944288 RepID=A0A0C9SPH4_PLICR|nr:hypothetical protein PLICRDRAFT_181222 [Plicaturopsis crispa FD-325 SS-3]
MSPPRAFSVAATSPPLAPRARGQPLTYIAVPYVPTTQRHCVRLHRVRALATDRAWWCDTADIIAQNQAGEDAACR